MMKRFGKALPALTLMGSVAGMAQVTDNKILHVYNQSDYIAPGTLEKFTKETGIRVVCDVYNGDEVLEAKLLADKPGYDVVVPSNSFPAEQIRVGVYQKLGKSKLPNRENLSKGLIRTLEVSDPGNEHAIPCMRGTIGVGYNPDKIKVVFGDNVPVDSWDLVFKPESIQRLRQCSVSLLDPPTEVLPATLRYLGYKPNTDNPKEFKTAEGLFPEIRSYVTYFHSSKYIFDLANDNVCIAISYPGGICQAKSRAEEAKSKIIIKYNIPKEGAGSFFDIVAIPKNAESTESTLAFVNFLMKPEIMAEITDVVQFLNGNAAAIPLVSEAIRNDPGAYPSEEATKKLYTLPNLSTKTRRAMTRNWTKVKSGK